VIYVGFKSRMAKAVVAITLRQGSIMKRSLKEPGTNLRSGEEHELTDFGSGNHHDRGNATKNVIKFVQIMNCISFLFI
jgi:hypothetical protein